MMQKISRKLQVIYYNTKIIPIFLCISVMIDYFLTFYFAGSVEAVLAYEFSPTLVYAISHGIVIPYLLFMVLFYYTAGYFVLDLLADSNVYYIGVAVIILMSATHVLGGFSWYVLNEHYSNAVLMLSLISVMLTIMAFGYEIIEYVSSRTV